MKSLWIIDILKDIRLYCLSSSLFVLAEEIDDTIVIAAHEIMQKYKESENNDIKSNIIDDSNEDYSGFNGRL